MAPKMMASVSCAGCRTKDVFINRIARERCECTLTTESVKGVVDDWVRRVGMDITTKTVASSEGMSKIVITPPTLKEIFERSRNYRVQTIAERDLEIEHAIEPAIRYVSKMLGEVFAWCYLDIGCGTMLPTTAFADILGVMPQGVDVKDRSRMTAGERYYHCVDESLSLDNEPDDGHDVITLTDILHHTPDPVALVDAAIKKLTATGFVIVFDHDCQGWADAYHLDTLHRAYASSVGPDTDDVIPVYGYRTRSYWRSVFTQKGFHLVWRSSPRRGYKTYVDVFQRA